MHRRRGLALAALSGMTLAVLPATATASPSPGPTSSGGPCLSPSDSPSPSPSLAGRKPGGKPALPDITDLPDIDLPGDLMPPSQGGGAAAAPSPSPTDDCDNGDKGKGNTYGGHRNGKWPVAKPGGARVLKEKRVDKRRLDLVVNSPAVGAQLPVRLLLPKGWKKKAKRTWPVVYMLHGGVSKYEYRSWDKYTKLGKYGANDDVIYVLPEGGRSSNYSNWYNYGRYGKPQWEDFHVKELRRILERKYRAGKRRAIAGLSMGGYGAIAYAAKNPGMFRYAAGFSGIFSPTFPGVPIIILTAQWDDDQDPYALWGDPIKDANEWARHDPVYLAENLRGTGIYLSAGRIPANGELDPPNRPWHPAHLGETVSWVTGKRFTGRLKRLGIPVQTHWYERGTHTWRYWDREFQNARPHILRALGAKGVKVWPLGEEEPGSDAGSKAAASRTPEIAPNGNGAADSRQNTADDPGPLPLEVNLEGFKPPIQMPHTVPLGVLPSR